MSCVPSKQIIDIDILMTLEPSIIIESYKHILTAYTSTGLKALFWAVFLRLRKTQVYAFDNLTNSIILTELDTKHCNVITAFLLHACIFHLCMYRNTNLQYQMHFYMHTHATASEYICVHFPTDHLDSPIWHRVRQHRWDAFKKLQSNVYLLFGLQSSSITVILFMSSTRV